MRIPRFLLGPLTRSLALGVLGYLALSLLADVFYSEKVEVSHTFYGQF